MVHSSMVRKRVPICTPSAPSIMAAAMPRPSATPPAAISGTSTAARTAGMSTIEVIWPMWPPASMPSAMMASAPARSMRLARVAEATTGATLQPAAFHMSMNLPGSPRRW